MEFHEILAIAQKRQLKKDKEVEELAQMAKQRRLERMQELEQARKTNTKEKPIVSTSVACNQEIKEPKTPISKSTAQRNEINRPQNKGNMLSETHRCNAGLVSNKRRSKESVITSNASLSKKSSTTVVSENQKGGVSQSASKGEDLKVQKPKKNQLSFAELLELAKRNETVDTKRKAFEDLIPCSMNSMFQKRDAENAKPTPPVTDTVKSCLSSKSNLPYKSQTPKEQTAVESPRTAKTSKSVDVKKTPTAINEVGKPSELNSKLHEFKSSVSRKATVSSSNTHPSASIVTSGTTLMRKSQEVNSSTARQITSRTSCAPQRPTVPSRSAIALQLQSRAAPSSVSNETSTRKPHPQSQSSIPIRKSDKLASEKQHISLTEKFSKNRAPMLPQNHTPSKVSQVKSKPEPSACDPVVHRIEPAHVTPTRPTIRSLPPPVCRGTGIAAQLGVSINSSSRMGDSELDYDYSDDDYASDDSFIDDSDVVESKEYARVVRDIHKALHFDPRKYKEVNPWDDLRSMEANYRDIEKEEKRSARLGAKEDALELERDMQRKKAKLASRG